MNYTIRTAAVTQKATNGSFNGDNLNLNGRVLSMDAANSGFKGAGKMNLPFAVALSSSAYNGYAGAALTALNDRLADLKADPEAFITVLDEYFAMIMLVSIDDLKVDFSMFASEMAECGRKSGVDIRVMHEDIFNVMHRI